MKVLQKVKQTLTIFFAVIVFITSTGFNVYQHHCSTNNNTSYSILFDNTSCDHSEKHHHIKNTHSASCCSDYTVFDGKSNCEEKECCEISKTYHKIEIQNKFEKLVKQIEFTTLNVLLSTSLFDFSDFDNFSISIIDKESPPLLYGKELIYFIKKIKIPSILF